MNWWETLLADAPRNSELRDWEVVFRGLLDPPWLAVPLMVLAAGAAFLLYLFERGRVHIVARIVMALVRTLALWLLIVLLLGPVLLAEFETQRPREVVLLVDNSLSLTQRDQRLSAQDRLRVAIAENRVAPDAGLPADLSLTDIPPETTANPSRAQLVRAVLTHPRLKLLEGLNKPGPLRVYLFGQRLHSTAGPAPAPSDAAGAQQSTAPADTAGPPWFADFKANETRTTLADAIAEVLLRNDGGLPAAIVVLTDGRDNASRATLDEAARECARLKVPLHIYGVGSSEIGNLQLKDVVVPETIFYEDAVAVLVRWRGQGFKQGRAEITLTLGDQVVASREVEVREGDDLREVLTFTPKKGDQREERLDLTARIRFRGNETFTDDNELRRPVRVVDRKVKVLYVENQPRWEYKFLQPALLRDRRVEASFVLINADPRVQNSGPPYLPGFPKTRQELFAFDLLILGDVPAGSLNPERIAWVRDFVAEGGGLVLIAGRQHAPASYHNTPLAEVLPVEFQPVKFAVEADARPQPFTPVLTRAGERSELMALADTPEENLHVWRNLPGFCWYYPVTKLRPGAVALLAHPRQKMGDEPMPLIAMHHYGKGTVLFLGCEETWRWRYNVRDRYFGRFWGQVVYQMGLPHLLGNPKRVQLALERSDNVLGRPGYVYARLFDTEYRPLTGEKALARLERLDPKPGEERVQTITLLAVPGQPGEYRALLPHDALGRFALTMDSPEPARLEYRVNLPPHHELEVAGMAEDELREAARISGGRFYREEDLHRLAADIKPQTAAVPVRREITLWNNPWLFALFVGLLTLEWVVRKFSNLS